MTPVLKSKSDIVTRGSEFDYPCIFRFFSPGASTSRGPNHSLKRTQQLSLLDGLVVSLMGTIMLIFTIASRSLFALIKQREDSDMGWSLYFAKPESVPEVICTVYIMGVSLLVASFIKLVTQKLSLLDGLVISFDIDHFYDVYLHRYHAFPGISYLDPGPDPDLDLDPHPIQTTCHNGYPIYTV
ncbi:transmembrane protein, putative, partial [Rhizoctonia solani AG-3 Rhs1AP]